MVNSKENRLKYEKSPYLRQHHTNPIHWYAWSDEAIKAARDEDKPIFLSIGYATCHWCHVMEGDSFVHQDVADILNKHFISIKVDREERPDVDAIYMKAIQAMTGQGGWPISIFLTPELSPFWGATFLPRGQFKSVLSQIAATWGKNRESITKTGEQLTTYLQSEIQSDAKGVLSEEALGHFYEAAASAFDAKWGGFGNAPKFPPAMALTSLLRLGSRAGFKTVEHLVTRTLDAMAQGGIYDHAGGGFHRYATDEKWRVPHFEKMLYDNALLTVTYLEAASAFNRTDYLAIAEDTLAYILRDMRSPEGAFYAAEDADSEKTEGKFYLWQNRELREILTPNQFSDLNELYELKEDGNFKISRHVEELEKAAGLLSPEASNILYLKPGKGWPWQQKKWQNLRQKLLNRRSKRTRPLRDEKILTSWNGLTIVALAKAYQITENKTYLTAAQTSAQFIHNNLTTQSGELLRRYCQGEAAIAAQLEDYAYLIWGLIELYQADFDSHWLHWAKALQELQDKLFWSHDGGFYFETDGRDKSLIMRDKTFFDQATPAGNSVSALNLQKLAGYFLNLSFSEQAKEVMLNATALLPKYPRGFPQLIQALDYFYEHKEVVISAPPDTAAKNAALRLKRETYAPSTIFALASGMQNDIALSEGKGTTTKTAPLLYYVCTDGSCSLPVQSHDEAVERLRRVKKLNLSHHFRGT